MITYGARLLSMVLVLNSGFASGACLAFELSPADLSRPENLLLLCILMPCPAATAALNDTDINGDGLGDFVIGAPLHGGASQGRAYLFYGRSTPFPGGAATTADVVLSGLGTTDSVSEVTLGDFNGDTYADLALGAPGRDTPFANSGTVYIFYGGPGGINSNNLALADVTLTGSAAAGLGMSLSAADINNDGFHDLVVGASGFSGGSGATYIFHGSASGIASGDTTSSTTTITSENAGDALGRFIHAADLDGDGYGDILISASDYPGGGQTGRIYFFTGGPGGIPSGAAGTAAVSYTGSIGGDEFGLAPTGGDITGDGLPDILMLDNTGKGYAYSGSASGFVSRLDTQADITFNLPGANSLTVSDLDLDGTADVLIGAPTFAASTGRLYYFQGRAAWPASITAAGAFGAYDGLAGGDRFGHGMRIRNINGVGAPELIVTANGRNTSAGAAYLYYDFGPGATNGNAASATSAFAGEGAVNSFGNDLH
ncbi:MAG: FG-GAP-like repeat-containing protein [Leptospirales bacterium]|jgi:hypothetical protein